jgi:hypothetical protein
MRRAAGVVVVISKAELHNMSCDSGPGLWCSTTAGVQASSSRADGSLSKLDR